MDATRWLARFNVCVSSYKPVGLNRAYISTRRCAGAVLIDGTPS